MTVSDRRKRLLLAGAAISALMVAAQMRPSSGTVRGPRDAAADARGASPVARQAPAGTQRFSRPVSPADRPLDADPSMTLVSQRLGLLVEFGVAAPSGARSFTVLGAG